MKVALVGGGWLGRGLAGHLGRAGERVSLLAPRPRQVPRGLWLRADAVTGAGLRRAVGDCDGVVALPGGGAEVGRVGLPNIALAARDAGARMVAVLPAPAGPRAPPAVAAAWEGLRTCERRGLPVVVLAVGPVYGPGDHCVHRWWTAAARGRRPAAVRPGIPVRPLAMEDLVEALGRLLRGRQDGWRWSLPGPGPVGLDEVLRAVARGAGTGLARDPLRRLERRLGWLGGQVWEADDAQRLLGRAPRTVDDWLAGRKEGELPGGGKPG